MAEIIAKSSFQQGVEAGKIGGKVGGKVEMIMAFLFAKFKSVPKQVTDEINKMTDPVALDSLMARIANCTSMEQVEEALK